MSTTATLLTRSRRAKAGRASESNEISKIFASSGLTLIATNTFSRKTGSKWVIRCCSCGQPVTREQAVVHNVLYALNKVWHREHFVCIRCKCSIGCSGIPFRECRSNRNYPICIDCYMEEYHPKCNVCDKALRETCVRAMGKLWHRCCFICTKCHSPFENGEYFIHNGKPYDVDCYYLTKYDYVLTPVSSASAGPLYVIESTGTDQKPADQTNSNKTATNTEHTVQESSSSASVKSVGTVKGGTGTSLPTYATTMPPTPTPTTATTKSICDEAISMDVKSLPREIFSSKFGSESRSDASVPFEIAMTPSTSETPKSGK